jgi:hypothetical protein
MNLSRQEPKMSDFAFQYEHCDIPEGTTLREYRAANRPAPRRRRPRAVIEPRMPRRRAIARLRLA